MQSTVHCGKQLSCILSKLANSCKWFKKMNCSSMLSFRYTNHFSRRCKPIFLLHSPVPHGYHLSRNSINLCIGSNSTTNSTVVSIGYTNLSSRSYEPTSSLHSPVPCSKYISCKSVNLCIGSKRKTCSNE